MKSKDVLIGMKVKIITKSFYPESLSEVREYMNDEGVDYLRIKCWNSYLKIWEVGLPQVGYWYFSSKDFEPYVEDEE